MSAGGDASAITESGDSPLHTLLSTICYTSRSDSTCVEDAQVFIDAGCKLDSTNGAGQTPMHLAVMNGYLSVARILIEGGCQIESPDGAEESPLLLAIRGAHYPVVEFLFLVQQGCDINAQDFDGKTPLHYAAHNGDMAVVHFLIHHSAQPPQAILHDALMDGGHDLHAIVCLLLEHGASITSRMKDGNTVLHTLLRRSHRWHWSSADYLSVAQLLIDKGCEVNPLNSVGDTPLHLAAQLGYIPIV
ncbi:ankyrin repeat-containing domain protein, partial [Melanogaster broomeanus]